MFPENFSVQELRRDRQRKGGWIPGFQWSIHGFSAARLLLLRSVQSARLARRAHDGTVHFSGAWGSEPLSARQIPAGWVPKNRERAWFGEDFMIFLNIPFSPKNDTAPFCEVLDFVKCLLLHHLSLLCCIFSLTLSPRWSSSCSHPSQLVLGQA